MAVKVNLSSGVQQLAASAADKSVHNQVVRSAITAFSLYNTLAINVSLTVYESPNGTSASGEPVANLTLGPVGSEDDSIDVPEVIGQGYDADIQLIVVINTAAVSLGELLAKLTYTQFTGDS
jgi:hypothetical protein